MFWSNWTIRRRIAVSFVFAAMFPLIISGSIGGILFNQTANSASDVIGEDLLNNEIVDLQVFVNDQGDLIQEKFKKYEDLLGTMIGYAESLLNTSYTHPNWNISNVHLFPNGAKGFNDDFGIGDLFIANYTPMSLQVNRTLDIFSTLGTLFEQITDIPEVLNTYIGTDGVDQVTRFFPYVNLTGLLDTVGLEGFDISQRPWYTGALSTIGTDNKINWAVYQDVSRGIGEYTATISAPFYNGTDLFGVVGIDIKASAWSNIISDLSYKESGYAFILENDDAMDIVTKPDIVDSSARFDEINTVSNITALGEEKSKIFKDIMDQGLSNGTFKMEIKTGTSLNSTVEKLYSYVKIKNTDWYLFTGILTSEIVLPADYVSDLVSDSFIDFIRRMITFEIVILISSIFLAFAFANSISNPLRELEKQTKRIEKGNFEFEPDEIKSDSEYEIDILRNSFATMSIGLVKILDAARNSSSIVVRSAEAVGSTIEEINASSEEVASTSQAMSDGASTQTELISDVNENIVEVQSIVEDIVKKIRMNTQEVAQIALQTNILALNAGIEASRAGDYGRGFAVVAENVRKLSDQSKIASERIATVAEEIQDTLQVSFDRISNTMLNVVSVSEETAASAEEVAAAAEEQTATLTQLQDAADELVRSSNEFDLVIGEFTSKK